MPQRYSSPSLTNAFSFSKNEELAVDSGSSDLNLPLSKVKPNRSKIVLTVSRSIYLRSYRMFRTMCVCNIGCYSATLRVLVSDG